MILGIQRTGTTLIRTAINSHPRVLCLGEMFNPDSRNARNIQKNGIQKMLSEDEMRYSRYLSKGLGRRISDMFVRNRVVANYLDWLYAQEGYSAVGFKFMYSHLKKYPSVATYIKNKNIHVIHVVRKNVLRTFLSYVTKEARKVAHSELQVEQVRVELPTDTLIAKLDQLSNDSNAWKKLFEASAPYLEVGYENFVNDRSNESSRIMKFLGLDENFELESRLVKLNTASLHEIITNYADIQECLKGTAYEVCLHE